MKSTKKKNRSLNGLYIFAILIVIVIVVINTIIRSVTVVQVRYDQGEKVIVELKKYADVFPLLTQISIIAFFVIIVIILLFTAKSNYHNKKRLEELTRIFESVGLDKVDTENSILDTSDLIVIEAWNRSIEEVTSINEKREKYFSQMIHDLNTPIQILKMNAKMNILKDDKKYAQVIEDQLKELERRISNFLYIEKISYFEKPDFRPIVMQTYLKEIGEWFKVLSIDITVNYASKEIVYITDKAMYGKILQNLIENAIKYGRDKRIVINVTDNKLEVINYIADDLELGNIFAEKKRYYSQNGNGLGVEIIKTYANLLNLQIESETSDGKFIVTIKSQTE